MMNEEELKQALEHDAQVPASQKFGTSSPAAPPKGGAELARLAHQAACLAVTGVIAVLTEPCADDEELDVQELERLVHLAERLDVLADKASAGAR
jgi:hypothetical protein